MGNGSQVLERLPYRCEVAPHQANHAECDTGKPVHHPAEIMKRFSAIEHQRDSLLRLADDFYIEAAIPAREPRVSH
jgi:hypothetical protein